MTRDEYWAVVEGARASADEKWQVADELTHALEVLSPDVVYGFLEEEAKLLRQSYSRALWGAAYLVNGGCSDDGFDYFRGWLLAQGRGTFERVVADADSLSDLVEVGGEAEDPDMLFAGAAAYFKLTGEYATLPRVEVPPLEQWDFDDAEEMKRRYPRIWAKRKA